MSRKIRRFPDKGEGGPVTQKFRRANVIGNGPLAQFSKKIEIIHL